VKPALSVIFFTVLSGAGFGLWALLGGALALDVYPHARLAVSLPLVLGFVFASAGLLSSTLHLGRPARAWRAFSQWDSSWLSREGVASVVTYVPAFVIAACLCTGVHPVWIRATGAVMLACAVATVVCTARIYTSLKPVAAWRDPRVLPLYLLFAFWSGGLWLWTCLSFVATTHSLPFAIGLLAVGAIAAALKWMYWRSLDSLHAVTAGHATGLERFGAVRAFEGPTTQENYLLREMAFVLARKHASRLRGIALLLCFALPALLELIGLLAPVAARACAPLAALSCTAGLFVERWLFFAQARHAVAAFFPEHSPD